MIFSFEDENNELGMNFANIEANIHFTPHHGCGPSWSEWSGGDPGYDPYIEVDSFAVVSIKPEGQKEVRFENLEEEIKKKIADWVDCKIDDKFVEGLWEYVDDERY